MTEDERQILDDAFAAVTTPKLALANDLVPRGYKYTIKLQVTSRWEMTSEKEVVLTKLDYPAPTITIAEYSAQATIVPTYREISLVTFIQKSSCEEDTESEDTLECAWEIQFGDLPPAVIDALPDVASMEQNDGSLRIPAFSLLPPEDPMIEANTYTFEVACTTTITDREAKATAVLEVRGDSTIYGEYYL
jgi:hypothetical protein